LGETIKRLIGKVLVVLGCICLAVAVADVFGLGPADTPRDAFAGVLLLVIGALLSRVRRKASTDRRSTRDRNSV
jgi:hypothetical protein